MATSILSVITEYCSIYVDDLNMSELAATDPPLFARNAWQLLKPALAKFTHPPEMQSYLSYEEPTYDSTTWVAPADYEASTGTLNVVYNGTATLEETDTYPITLETKPGIDFSGFTSWTGYINDLQGSHSTLSDVPVIMSSIYDEYDMWRGTAFMGTMNNALGFIAYDDAYNEHVLPGTYKLQLFTTSTFRIHLGEEYKDYDLCGVRMRYYDRTGNLVLVPMPCYYDAATGDVFVAPTQDVAAGAEFEVDFYKDGQFNNTLTPQMCDIIGLCFQYVWQDRFNTDWLSIVSKIEDKSFQEQNRANKMNSDGMRLREMAVKLYDSMRKFEQDVAYKSRFPGGTGIQIK